MDRAEKRKNREPTGLTPTNKDPRTGSSSSTVNTIVESHGLTYAEVLTDTHDDNTSVFESTTSQRSHYAREHRFAGKATGSHRDQVTVDVLTIDGHEMKDQLTQTERIKVFQKMGLRPEIYNGECPGFQGHPIYTFRLKEVIDISSIPNSKIIITRIKKNSDG